VSYVDDRYKLAVEVYALTHTALQGLNDAVVFKLYEHTEVEALQRIVASAMLKAQDFKEKMQRELDAAEDA
jgi:hypothetical protein